MKYVKKPATFVQSVKEILGLDGKMKGMPTEKLMVFHKMVAEFAREIEQ